MTTNVAAHEHRPATGIGTSLRQQAVLLGVSGRWIYLIMGLLALLMLVGLSDLPPEVPRMIIIAELALLGGLTWAVMVWFGEGPDRRSYHWSLPVSRPAHDLARVAVGVPYLIGVCAVLAGAGAIAASANGTFDRFATLGAREWANFFLTPQIVYLLVMPVVQWSAYAITRWTFVITFGLGLLAAVLSWQGVPQLGEAMATIFEAEQWGLGAALFDWKLHMLGPVPDDPKWMAAGLWLTVGIAFTVFTAMFRPDDLRRVMRRG